MAMTHEEFLALVDAVTKEVKHKKYFISAQTFGFLAGGVIVALTLTVGFGWKSAHDAALSAAANAAADFTNSETGQLLESGVNRAKTILQSDSVLVPIGTVVSSLLSPDQLDRIYPGGQFWVHWAPADGNATKIDPSTPYAMALNSIGDGDNALHPPDLRGMFLRGLNTFHADNTRIDGRGDPDSPSRTSAGEYQTDAFKGHSHDVNFHAGGKSAGGPHRDIEYGTPNGDQLVTTTRAGAAETRPRNVSVYFYIRIR